MRLGLIGVVLLGCVQVTRTPARPVVFATVTRPPDGELEQALVAQGFVLDPALDCVAARSGAAPDPARYRGELTLACGSPFLPFDARAVDKNQALATAAEMRAHFAGNRDLTLALGIAQRGGTVTLVVAARGIELDPPAGDGKIQGRLLLHAEAVHAIVSRASGLTEEAVSVDHDRFLYPVPAGDADVELVLVHGDSRDPIGRLRFGAGSSLFPAHGALGDATNAARRALGLAPLRVITEDGTCDQIPSSVGGVDVTDETTCVRLPGIDPRDLGPEAATSPWLQSSLLRTDRSLLQVGEDRPHGQAMVRLLRPFEPIAPADGRAKVLASLWKRWPNLVVRPSYHLDGMLAAVALEPEPKSPDLFALAGQWAATPETTRWFATIVASRELDAALAKIGTPSSTPVYVDVDFLDARDAQGALRHLVAVMLALP